MVFFPPREVVVAVEVKEQEQVEVEARRILPAERGTKNSSRQRASRADTILWHILKYRIEH